LTKKEMATVIAVYFAISFAILMSRYFFPAEELYVIYVPVLLSILLLVPLYLWQKHYRKRMSFRDEIAGTDVEKVLFWVFVLFALAMAVRIPSVLLFNQPYEKTPLIYLVVLTILVVEKNNISTFGFKTEHFAKALLHGAALFVILGGLVLTVYYGMIYLFTAINPVQPYDVMPFLLIMPFMTFCVGISEEGLFRGYIQTHLEKVCTSKQAILAQAILFGGWHFVWYINPFDVFGMVQHVIFSFLIGLLFGYFYSKARNLTPLVLAHGLWNSFPQGIIENASAISAFGTVSASIQISALILPYVVSAAVTAVFIKYFVKRI
jgi:membrane protease YdiL (CAAX protease family)